MSAVLLEVEDLHVQFAVRRGDGARAILRAVDGVSLTTRRGRTLGLVGESGCGKTSLVRAILGLQLAASGQARLDGDDLLTPHKAARRALSSKIQVVFQDPYSALNPTMTVHEIVAEPLRIHGRYDAARVARLLDGVGLAAASGARKPAEFSGGQRQRIGIARALALNPELLILDEPVSALDVSVQAQVLNLLTDLQRERGLSYLFIAHDLSVVRHMAPDVAVMYLGKIVETGPRDAVFNAPAHPYTRRLIDAAPRAWIGPDRGARRTRALGEPPNPMAKPSGCAFRTRCPIAQDRCAAETPPLAPYGDQGRLAACWYPGQGDAP
jgi:oligopeptide/dipeptide ABC transporter ATP-binding protein